MPEMLGTGGTGETSFIVPAAITLNSGVLYQLWLVALNSKGSSAQGPVQSWTAG